MTRLHIYVLGRDAGVNDMYRIGRLEPNKVRPVFVKFHTVWETRLVAMDGEGRFYFVTPTPSANVTGGAARHALVLAVRTDQSSRGIKNGLEAQLCRRCSSHHKVTVVDKGAHQRHYRIARQTVSYAAIYRNAAKQACTVAVTCARRVTSELRTTITIFLFVQVAYAAQLLFTHEQYTVRVLNYGDKRRTVSH